MSLEKHWHEVFLKRILIIGCLLAFLIPPIQAADENVHFYNAYAFMKGDFFPEYEHGTYMGRVFPKDIVDYVESWNSDADRRASIEETMNYPGPADIDESNAVFLPYWASESNMLGYIFSGSGMLICSIVFGVFGISISGYDLLMAGRICNLLFYAIATYYAIKWTPYYKKTLLLIALMPMTLFQAATLSYDAILFPCCFLLFAIIVRGIKDENVQITKGLFLIMCFISIVLFLLKTVYAPLLLGLAFIPKERFGGKKRYIIAGCIIVGCGAGSLAVSRMFLAAGTPGFQNPYGDLYAGQIQHLSVNLVQFVKYIFNSFRKYSGFYFSSFIGIIGKLDLALPKLIAVYYGAFLIVTACNESACGNILKLRDRILMGSMLLLIVYMSFAGIYVTWTAIQQGVGVTWVDGIQGRYFIPIAVYIPLIFSHKRLLKAAWCNGKLTEEIVFYTITVIPILTLVFELLRFWNI